MIFLVFIFTSRIINEKANKKLTSEKKVELIELFSNSRIMTYVFIILLVGSYFLILKYKIFEPLASMVIYMILLLIFIVFKTKSSYDKLKLNNFPDAFIKSYLLASVIRVLGILLFFWLLTR